MFGWGKEEEKKPELSALEKGRAEAAQRSKERKAAEAEKLRRENAERQKKLKAARQTAATDTDIADEEAGRRRIQLAAESKARKEREAAERAKENAERAKRIAAARTTKTDTNIADEEAGRMRLVLAAESKARRRREAEELERRLADMKERIARQAARNDSDITDEEVRRHPCPRPCPLTHIRPRAYPFRTPASLSPRKPRLPH